MGDRKSPEAEFPLAGQVIFNCKWMRDRSTTVILSNFRAMDGVKMITQDRASEAAPSSAPDNRHLPGESTGVRPAREVSASGPGGSLLGSGTPRRAGCTGDGVEYRGQPFLGQARATELLRQLHLLAPDIQPPSRPEKRYLYGPGGFASGS